MNRFAEISNALHDVYRLDEELGRRVYDTTNRVLASVESAIANHWIISVECNHARKTDKAACACGYVTWECKSVGEAVAAFAQHVMAVADDGGHMGIVPDQKPALAGGIAPPSAWISVSERLPVDSEPMLAMLDDGHSFEGIFAAEEWYGYNIEREDTFPISGTRDRVTHWQPLPAPPSPPPTEPQK